MTFRFPFLALGIILACGPSVEDPSAPVNTGSGTEGTPQSESGSGTGTGTGESLMVSDVRHWASCIDSCRSFYLQQTLDITFEGPAGLQLTVEWFDWARSDRELSADAVLAVEELTLTDEPTSVSFNVSVNDHVSIGGCSQNPWDGGWDGEARVLLRIDGEFEEVLASSFGGPGYNEC